MKTISFLSKAIEGYVKYRKASGRYSYSYIKNIIQFDHFCVREYPEQTELTQEIVDRWCRQRPTECTNSCVSRVYPVSDFIKYMKKREIFAQVAIAIKKSRTISTEKAGHFTISVSARPFANATDLKTVGLKQVSLTNAFAKYGNPIQYLDELKAAGVESNRIYKLFAAIDYRILNSSGLPVSGGERSEFNFLQKIKDAILCDILIIDEPESSFDNLFLKNEVNKFIKEMAENMPVIISTHNNTIGGSIKPDYILYTETKIEADGVHFNIYSGYPTAQTLRDVKGNTIENYEITLNSLEAGEQAYSERKDIYETLKN